MYPHSFEITSLEDEILEINALALPSAVLVSDMPDYDARFYWDGEELCIDLDDHEEMTLGVLGSEGTYYPIALPFEPATELTGAHPKRRRPYGI